MFLRLLCVAVFVVVVYGNVLGIDFGSEFVKIACPHGNSSIDIVLNEQTRRKSNNFIGFRGDDRFFGEDAKNLAARFPDNMFAMVNKLLGVKGESTTFKELLHTFALTNNGRELVSVKCSNNPACEFTAEEIVAMFLEYCKLISAKDAKIKPQDIVVTIPADWTMLQKQTLVDAASLVDLRVLSLMHSTTATALQFGMQKRGFGNDTVNVVIYDMGATKTEVGVYRFSPPPQPKNNEKLKLAVSMGHLETLHIEVDSSLGGRTLDACLAHMLEDEIVEKLQIPRIIGGSSPQQHKAQFALMRAANGLKETLSANMVAPVTVEGVAPDKDFSTKVTREQFEKQCSALFERAVSVAKRALLKSNLSVTDITSFELMGGGPRPPKIVTDLSSFLGRNVDRTLNSDESAAFGSAYYGARLSGYFRVRSFSVADYLPESVYFQLVDSEGRRSARRPLFERAVFGSRRSITVNRTSDFTIELSSTKDGVLFAPLNTVNVSGVAAALESMNFFDPKIVHQNNTHIVRVELKLQETGAISVEDVEVRYRHAVNVTKKVKVNTAQINATEPAEQLNETEPETKTIFEIQMKKRSTSLKPSVSKLHGQLGAEEEIASKSVLSSLAKADKIKRDTATAKNALETYIQWVRGDGILENEEVSRLIDVTERELISTTTADVKEWYEDGEGSYDSCTKLEYDEKLALLKNVTSAVKERLQAIEDAKKPKAEEKKKKEREGAKRTPKSKPTKQDAPEDSDSGTTQTEEL